MFFLRHWYTFSKTWLSYILLPISFLFKLIAFIRRFILTTNSSNQKLPTIVIGNITLGGTGKTNVVASLCKYLIYNTNYNPVIISRGFHSYSKGCPLLINRNTSPTECGDEPYMLYRILDYFVPILVDKNRCRAINYVDRYLLSANVIITDDGLQHYNMSRYIEILAIDSIRVFGNRLCLPAGPLRESIQRIDKVDAIVLNGFFSFRFDRKCYQMKTYPKFLVNIFTQEKRAIKFHNTYIPCSIHAVAGIGNPVNFFHTLLHLGYNIQTHIFPDHYQYSDNDFLFDNALIPVIMTYKDAVKCKFFARNHWWYLLTEIRIQYPFYRYVHKKLNRYTR
jgi:tetraacyldisaccharide 4'-kinase